VTGKVDYLPRALKALEDAPATVRKAFFKQIGFLEQNLQHPSLHAKKYDETQDIWQPG
jgi:mRNA-degrading endonuclease RelE of RelBE toxin-antitoxin system